MKDYEKRVRGLGEIIQWPGGFSMTLGFELGGSWTVRCCDGHPTPGEAKAHGLVRLVEVASRVGDLDVTTWAAREVA